MYPRLLTIPQASIRLLPTGHSWYNMLKEALLEISSHAVHSWCTFWSGEYDWIAVTYTNTNKMVSLSATMEAFDVKVTEKVILYKAFSTKNKLSCSCVRYISPHWVITTGNLGLLLGPVGTFSIFLTTRRPSITLPKTTCLSSRKSHLVHVMKNWHPFVLGPLFAIERMPGASCFSLKFSSLNFGP